MASSPAVLNPEDVEIEQPKAPSLDASEVEFEQPAKAAPAKPAPAKPTPSPQVPESDTSEIDMASGMPSMPATSSTPEFINRAIDTGLNAAKKYAVDPFEKLAQKGAEVGRGVAENALHVEPFSTSPGMESLGEVTGQPAPPSEVGAARAVGSVVGSTIADPRNAPMAAGGFTNVIMRRLMSMGFSALMAKGAIEQSGELGAIIDDQSIAPEDKVERGTSAVLSTLMAAQAGTHAVMGEPSATEVSQHNTLQEGVQAMVESQQAEQKATRVAQGLPPEEPQPKPPIITNKDVKARSAQIKSLPEEQQPEAIAQSHQELSKLLADQGVHVNEDKTVEPITSPKQAASVAADIINKEAESEKSGESELEAVRRGAPGEAPAEEPVNQVPEEHRASTASASSVPQGTADASDTDVAMMGNLGQRLYSNFVITPDLNATAIRLLGIDAARWKKMDPEVQRALVNGWLDEVGRARIAASLQIESPSTQLRAGDPVELQSGEQGKVAYIPASGKRIPITLEDGRTKWTMRDLVKPGAQELRPEDVEVEHGTKEPWQMTKAEWMQQRPAGTSPGMHSWEIKKALKEGKDVPAAVLKDYPALQPSNSAAIRGPEATAELAREAAPESAKLPQAEQLENAKVDIQRQVRQLKANLKEIADVDPEAAKELSEQEEVKNLLAQDENGASNGTANVSRGTESAVSEAARGAAPAVREDSRGSRTEVGLPEGTEARAEEAVSPATSYSIADHDALIKKLTSGEVSAEELRANYDRVKANEAAIKEELAQKTVLELKKMIGGYYRPDMKKAGLVDHVYEGMLGTHTAGKGVSYSMSFGDLRKSEQVKREAYDKVVASVTDEDIQKYADERKQRSATIVRTLTNPETLDEFENFIRYRGKDKLSPQQKIKYDELVAERNKEQAGRALEDKARVAGVQLGETQLSYKEGKHTKTGEALHIVQLSDRVAPEKYRELLGKAKQLGGHYSSFIKADAGFHFKTKEAADKFIDVGQGKTVSRLEDLQARKTEVKDNAVDRLRSMADSMEEKANESLNQDRQDNTARRARMAASAEASAQSDIALAKTMRNLAQAIEEGKAKHLEGIRARTHVEALNAALYRAKLDAGRAAGERYEVTSQRPATVEDIEKTIYPYPVMPREDLLRLASELEHKPGARLAAARVRKMQEDKTRGIVIFRTEKEIDDLRALADKSAGLQRYMSDRAKEEVRDYDRMQSMGIPDLPTLRAALREYLQYKGDAAKTDTIKAMKRELVGQDFPGFFPTPEEPVNEMLRKADIQPGMKVLEPSAGWGNIADAIRSEHPDADLETLEWQPSLRKILEASGHNVVGNDFMEHKGEYDRIVMNPPFEDGQDMEHVQRAYDMLKPGGKLVAVMSEGSFFRSDRKATGFREWLDEHGGDSEKLEPGAFKSSERPTGVATRLVTIDKPSGNERVVPGARSSSTGNETGRSDIQQLTESIRSNAPEKSSLLDRVKLGQTLGEAQEQGKGAVNEALGRVKGFTAALWDAYKNPRSSVLLPRGDGKNISDYERAVGNWSFADNSSALDLYKFRKAAEESTPDKARRGALGIWMEAGGDQEKLEKWAKDMAGDKKYAPIFDAATKLTDGERTIAQNVLNRNDATLAEMQKAGILREGIENYLMHVWEENPKLLAQVRAQTNFDSLKLKPSFTKERVIPTYFDGIKMGYTPKDLDYASLTAAHERGLREALAARAFIKELKDGKGADGRPLVATNTASARVSDTEGQDPAYFISENAKPGDNYADYRSVDHPSLRGWKWAAEVDGKPVFVQGDLMVHPEVYRHLKNNLTKSAIRNYEVDMGGKTIKPGELALSVSQGIKHTILSLSRFHKTTLEIHALEHQVQPYSHLPELDLSDKNQAALVKGGMMVAHYEGMDAFSDGVASGGVLEKIPGIGDWIHGFNERLFKEFMPQLKMKVGLAALDRNRTLYGERMSDEKIAQVTAKEMNAAFGGLAYRQLGRNKTMQDALRLFFMAPDFMEARAKFVGQAMRPEGGEQLRAYLLGAAVLYGGARVLNEMLDGKAHWDKPFSVVHNGKEYRLRTVQGDTLEAVTNPATFAKNRLSPIASTGIDFAEHKDMFGKKQPIGKLAKDEAKRNVPMPIQPWLKGSKDTNAQKAVESALKVVGINVRKEQK